MYHYYDGGGVTIDGPSLLVRKKFAEKYAVNASYYVDMVSSASIDVITTASPYKEERTQYGVGFEYLRGKVTYAASFSNSSENDYDADTASLSISQDMFGDLTTVSLFFTRGWDDVYPPRRRHLRRPGRPAHLRRRRLAGRDQEPDPRPLLRDDHRGGIPQ